MRLSEKLNDSNRILLPAFSIGIEDSCAYCGEPYEEIDHAIPISFLQSDRAAPMSSAGPLVQSCAECNGILSDKFFSVFVDRIKHVNEAYVSKARRYRGVPEWDWAEVAELDRGLGSYVAHHQDRMKQLDRKVTYFGGRGMDRLFSDIRAAHFLDPRHSKFNQFYAEFFAWTLK